jgi:hypothetical protein
MSFTYDLGTNIGKVRMLIPDHDEDNAIFTDEEIEAFLSLEDNSIRRAAAVALETMAANDAYVLKNMSLLDINTNGPAVSAALLQRAALLREQAKSAEETDVDELFGWAEMVYDDFSARERLDNEALRNA